MEGIIINYRGSHHTQKNRQMILVVKGIASKKAAENLAQKTVVWKSPAGKELLGEITQPHGVKGAVRVHFPKGLPGQAVGAAVEVR